MIRLIATVVVACALATHPVRAACNPVVSTLKVDSSFTDTNMMWNGNDRGGAELRWRVTSISGRLHICGAVTYKSISNRRASQGQMHLAQITYKDRPILQDLTFFREVRNARNLSSAVANCAATNMKTPKGAYTVYIKWSSLRHGRSAAKVSCRR